MTWAIIGWVGAIRGHQIDSSQSMAEGQRPVAMAGIE